ncbi:SIMPL domain-containing protein [Sulfurospirillum diekertiae]|uniref:SIMPL domain-containing protein n=1 Tax=Sulfurospirillum diekertiae TaxID=1854492 RepID=A0A6G9VQ90_9BACT|nr:SIMPL domain-containing protein [Sulfurospirillum diekertiae]QIR75041.1 SIMPL domain-containing protein [Sulfurospirillum diekertiae]QIR77707.1 SIMPL domain-containing protein [Sulfurospirillum diekertiae]
MKIRVMLLLSFLPLFASAAMSITTNEHVSQALTPDVLRAQIGFEEQNKSADGIKEHLNAIVASVKQFDPKGEFCQGGGYYLTPRYTYKDQKQIFIGYGGTLSFGCDFKSIDHYNALLAAIQKIKAQSVLINQSALTWEVSLKARNSAHLAMRTSLLQTASEQASFFSKETKMHCEISAVTFEGTEPQPVMMKRMLARANAPLKEEYAPTEEPILHEETLFLSATVNYTCATK